MDSGGAETAATVDVFEATPYTPIFAVDELPDAVNAVMYGSFLLPIDLYVWTDALLMGSLGTGDTCPAVTDSVDQPGAWTSFWGGSCTGDGYAVSGDWQYTVERVNEPGNMILHAVELHSVIGETVPDGARVAAGGAMVIDWESDGITARFRMYYGGQYLEEGRTDPIGQGLGGTLWISGSFGTEAGLEGVMDGAIYGVLASVAFTNVAFTPGCAAPSGLVRVRDPSSVWWDIDLATDCSGCGPARFGGEEQGEVCLGEVLTERVVAHLQPYVGGVP